MSLQLFDLPGRTALVPGSARGLGHAIAAGLAKAAGARIAINGTDAARCESAAQSPREQAHDAVARAFDVASESAVIDAFKQFDAQGIEVDIVVNNAGIQRRKPLVGLALADWQRVIDTNLTSAFLVGREAARRMIERKRGGKTINIGSLTDRLR